MIFKNCLNNPLNKLTNGKLKYCMLCNTSVKGGNFANFSNLEDLNIVFIAQNPGKSWWNKNVKPEEIIPFDLENSNSYHKFFDKCFSIYKEKYGRDLNFYVTNLVKYVTYDNSLTNREEVLICKRHLEEELLLIKNNPNYKKIGIILLGKYVSDYEASIVNLSDFNKLTIPHPGWMNRQLDSVSSDYALKTINFLDSL